MTNETKILAVAVAVAAAALAACDDGSGSGAEARLSHDAVGSVTEAVSSEDGLAEAYQVFRSRFIGEGQDQRFTIGFGFHPGIVTTKVATSAGAASGSATLVFAEGRVEAQLRNVPATERFDLWFVKNVEGSGRTVRPESGDLFRKIGTFAPSDAIPGTQILNLTIGTGASAIDFDLDQVVVTRTDQHPRYGVVATGARTLLEKRFFRERAGKGLDPVSGAILENVETTDALVARGAFLFFNETFGGNGRTCGTCHRAEDNLTISPGFIATLPQSDPLFVAENDPALAELENPLLLRHDALIKENVDGLEDPTRKFVLRGVPHTLAMSTSIGKGDLVFPVDAPPPDFRLGWGGDGSPGRGSLNEFAFGAVIQHFTRRLDRVAGVDFRVPTQAELDALEAFQLFSGRQKNPQVLSITFRESRVENGKNLFQGQAACVVCHRDIVAGNENFLVDTDIERILIAAPRDGGFGTVGTDTQGGIGTGRFNVPPLIEAADTTPLFHNNTIQTIEEAVAFYTTDVFFFSPGRGLTGPIVLTAEQIDDVAAFLRTVNAAENLRQTRKRTVFVQNHRSAGNSDILRVAIADLGDAIDDLEPKGLSPAAVRALKTAKQTLEIGLANPDDLRPAFAQNALVWLDLARADLFVANPLNEF